MQGPWGSDAPRIRPTMGGPLLGPRLFVPEERWGWEFLAPGRAVLSPEANTPPVRQEVYLPANYAQLEVDSKRAWRGLVRYGILTLWLAGLASLIPNKAWIGSAVLFVGMGLTIGRYVMVRNRFKSAKARYESGYKGVDEAFAREYAAWQQRVAEHDRNEAARIAAAMRWIPVRLTSRPSRVDVFGGTSDGWASLLTTAGAASMALGSSVLVLDFTERLVASELVDLAIAGGYPVEMRDAPECLPKVNLLQDLDPADIAEVVAETVHTLQTSPMSPDLRGLHSNLVLVVAQTLEKSASFTRLHAGLRVLRRVYDVESETVLTASEFRKLNSAIDTVGTTDQVHNELLNLTAVLDVLVAEERSAGIVEPESFGAVWPVRGLSVVATHGTAERRKKLLDLTVFQRTLCELRMRRPGGRQVLVVAGADHVGLESLEAMARQARRVGVQLVLLLEHLRDDLQKLLGGSDSVALVMRLGNAAEASAAADYFGRGHKFEISALTIQEGQTTTRGWSRSVGESKSESHTRGYTVGGGFSSGPQGSTGSSTWSGNRANTTTRAQNWQDSWNRSVADSRNESGTLSRVYEYSIEPTTIQGLAPTAFLMIEEGPASRRVVVGDCNPFIAFLERVGPGYPSS